ncbi:MAG TPA: FAD-dependent oxidoreductase [Candidatus Limnocylindrales bacterium]|nr:FAD-dependent oxidoreductase [Candidatus Limnocylindrales bacterium]
MKVVVVGSGPAGIVAAEQLRARDPELDITMISQEPHPPYSPPALADHFMTGRTEPLFWKGTDVCERLRVDYRSPARVLSIDPDTRHVRLDDGSSLGWDALLIASGSRLDAPIVRPGMAGIHDFKSLQAATAIVDRVRRGEATTAIIVGTGFIGMEIGLLLSDLGVHVRMIGRRTWVMPRVLDPETAGIAANVMLARGVELLLGVEAVAFEERDGVASGVRLATDEILTADLYVAATGVRPNVELLDGSGVAHEWGITVDDRLRTTVPGIWAAGDVVEAPDRRTGRRYVHAIFPNAVDQARVVAANILGGDVVYAGAESMNSLKHLGLPVMAVGEIEGEDELRWRAGDNLRKVFLTGGRIVGFRLAGDIGGGGLLRSLMLRGEDVRRFGTGLVRPGFGVASEVLPAVGI